MRDTPENFHRKFNNNQRMSQQKSVSNITGQSEKYQERSPEDEKLMKLKEIVKSLDDACKNLLNTTKHKSKTQPQNTEQKESKNISKLSNINKTMAFKGELNSDKQFITNFLNDDIVNILPKNMHLLSDNDTNQNISNAQKFKNLADLMLDDDNITENAFGSTTEEKIILNLFNAFSRKSKEVYLEEDQNINFKRQIMFHKINNIKIPTFDYKIGNVKNENPVENNKECFFRGAGEKGYFHEPVLKEPREKIITLKKSRSQRELLKIAEKDTNDKINYNTFWDPEIDTDFLSYINHNFICLEKIYNKKYDINKEQFCYCNKNIDIEEDEFKINDKNDYEENNDKEDNVFPVDLKEIKLDDYNNDPTKESINLFKEYRRNTPNIVDMQFKGDTLLVKEKSLLDELKKNMRYRVGKKISNLMSVNEDYFELPKIGDEVIQLNNRNFYRYVKRRINRTAQKIYDFCLNSDEEPENDLFNQIKMQKIILADNVIVLEVKCFMEDENDDNFMENKIDSSVNEEDSSKYKESVVLSEKKNESDYNDEYENESN